MCDYDDMISFNGHDFSDEEAYEYPGATKYFYRCKSDERHKITAIDKQLYAKGYKKYVNEDTIEYYNDNSHVYILTKERYYTEERVNYINEVSDEIKQLIHAKMGELGILKELEERANKRANAKTAQEIFEAYGWKYCKTPSGVIEVGRQLDEYTNLSYDIQIGENGTPELVSYSDGIVMDIHFLKGVLKAMEEEL